MPRASAPSVPGRIAMCQSAKRGRARLVWIDDDQAGAVAARLLHHRPQVDIVAVDVAAPGDDQLRELEIFRGGAQFLAIDKVPRHPARFRADGAIELAGAEAMKEAPVHRPVAKNPHRPRIAVWQNRLRAVLIADLLQALRDRVQRFIPGDPIETLVFASARQRALGRAGLAPQGVEKPLRRIDAIEVLGHFAAKKPVGDRLRRIARYLDRPAFLVHRDQHCARVRAVVGADRVNDAEGGILNSGHTVIVS